MLYCCFALGTIVYHKHILFHSGDTYIKNMTSSDAIDGSFLDISDNETVASPAFPCTICDAPFRSKAYIQRPSRLIIEHTAFNTFRQVSFLRSITM